MGDNVVDLGEFHRRMVVETGRYFGRDLVRVATYERFKDSMPVPMVIYELESAPEAMEAEIGTGELVSDLSFVAYVVVDGMDDGAALLVRRLAMRLKGFLHRNNFGMRVDWPRVGEARDAEFDWPKGLENGHRYEIWRVEFVYSGVVLGENCWVE